ncbi:MAG TPA: hypothetical protein VGM69_23920 [Chloroflexota bacterium]
MPRLPLWEINTQTVFGEGPADAAVMFVGEELRRGGELRAAS